MRGVKPAQPVRGAGTPPRKVSASAAKQRSWRSQLPKVVHDFWDTALAAAFEASRSNSELSGIEPHDPRIRSQAPPHRFSECLVGARLPVDQFLRSRSD